MGDIALYWSKENAGDIATSEADLLTDDGLETALIMSLFTDRRVSVDEDLPASETDRRGWWGDVVPVVPGDIIGSRLWLLAREKQLADVITRAKEYAAEAVQWLIDDKVAQRVDVVAESTKPGQLDIQVTVYRPLGDAVQFKFDYAWQAQAAMN